MELKTEVVLRKLELGELNVESCSDLFLRGLGQRSLREQVLALRLGLLASLLLLLLRLLELLLLIARLLVHSRRGGAADESRARLGTEPRSRATNQRPSSTRHPLSSAARNICDLTSVRIHSLDCSGASATAPTAETMSASMR